MDCVFLDLSVTVVHGRIFSFLVYCSSLYSGLSFKSFACFQLIENAAARLLLTDSFIRHLILLSFPHCFGFRSSSKLILKNLFFFFKPYTAQLNDVTIKILLIFRSVLWLSVLYFIYLFKICFLGILCLYLTYSSEELNRKHGRKEGM